MQGKLFKGISLILVLVLLVNMLSVSVFAQQLRIEGPLPAAGPESPGIEPVPPATETASVVAELKEDLIIEWDLHSIGYGIFKLDNLKDADLDNNGEHLIVNLWNRIFW